MDDKKMKEGMSIREIESFAKNHRFEVFFCIAFILACFFSFVMFGTGWAIIAAAIGAIIGVLMPLKILSFGKTVCHFFFKQEKTTQMVLAIVCLILAIFLPFLFFLLLGLHGGKDLMLTALEISRHHKNEP